MIPLDELLGIACPLCCQIYATSSIHERAPTNALTCGHTVCVKCYRRLCERRAVGDGAAGYFGLLERIPPFGMVKCPTCSKSSKIESNPVISYTLIGLVTELVDESNKNASNSQALKCVSCYSDEKIHRAFVCVSCSKESEHSLCGFCCMSNHMGHNVKRYTVFKNSQSSAEKCAKVQRSIRKVSESLKNCSTSSFERIDSLFESLTAACSRIGATSSETECAVGLTQVDEVLKRFEEASSIQSDQLHVFVKSLQDITDIMNNIQPTAIAPIIEPNATSADIPPFNFLTVVKEECENDVEEALPGRKRKHYKVKLLHTKKRKIRLFSNTKRQEESDFTVFYYH